MTMNAIVGQHKHVASQIRDLNSAVDIRTAKKVSHKNIATTVGVDAAIAAHAALPDPHPQYSTSPEAEAKVVATLVAGSNITLSYNPSTGKITVSLNVG